MISLFTIAQHAYTYGYNGFHSENGGASYDSTAFIGLALIIVCSLIGYIVQSGLKSAVAKYSAQPAPMTGAQAAERMLRDNGIRDVSVVHVQGKLTDHFNPLDKTVNLSDTVYSQANVAAIAVAAHECGHAVQHAQAYPWIGLRSALVPMVNIGSRLGQIVLIAGLALLAAGSSPLIAWIGVGLFATTTVFALVTLPVEFDASRRALAWLRESGLADGAMHGEAKTALGWAAMTYVSAALSSLAMLLYYVMLILSRSQNRD